MCVWHGNDLFHCFSTLQHVSNHHSQATSVQISLVFMGLPFASLYNSFIHSLIWGTLYLQEAGHSGYWGYHGSQSHPHTSKQECQLGVVIPERRDVPTFWKP